MDYHGFKPYARGNMDLPFFQDEASNPSMQQWTSPESWDMLEQGSVSAPHNYHTETLGPANAHHHMMFGDHADMPRTFDPALMALQSCSEECHGDCHDDCHVPYCDLPDECHEDCHLPYCDSPECEALEILQCTDAACLSPAPPGSCMATRSVCAGELPADVLQGAVSLHALRPHSAMEAPCASHYPAFNTSFSLEMQYHNIMHGTDQEHYAFSNMANAYHYDGGNMTQETANIMNELGMLDSSMDYSAFSYTTALQSMPLPESSTSSSSPTPQMSLSFSQEQTPTSMSSFPSPHHTLSDPLIQRQDSPSTIGHFDCQWEFEDGVICSYQFATKAELQEHIQIAHTKPLNKARGFICRWHGCPRLKLDSAGFAQRSKLDRHIQSHTGYKASVCPQCGQEFSTAQTLESHMRTHTGIKPYPCTFEGCNYRAAQASQLTMHIRTKHTKEKPLKCDFPGCTMAFAESSNLSKHRKIHQPPERCICPYCSKSFDRKDQMKRHLKTTCGKRVEALNREPSLLSSPPPLMS